jgi:RNA polymerase sigma-32 factor
MGLVVGIQRFDPTRGIKLGTYVSYWIRCYILDAILNHSHIIKLSKNTSRRKVFYNYRKQRALLEAQGIEATSAAVAEKLNVKEEDVAVTHAAMQAPVYLDAAVDASSDMTRMDMLVSDGVSPDEAFDFAERVDQLEVSFKEFRKTLKDNERKVFDLRMLRGEDEGWTLQAVGDELGVTRERVRQIQNNIEPKLKRFCLRNGISL